MAPKQKQDVVQRFFFGDGITSTFMNIFDRIVSVANMVLSSALIWMIFTLVFRNNMPLVVVLSNSMEPDFIRGDLLLAVSPPHGQMFPNGQICAYNVITSPVPIVHRMIETHNALGKKQILTKGDNNEVPDNWLYKGMEFYYNDEVETMLVAVLPKLGWVSIAVKESKIASIFFITILSLRSFYSPDTYHRKS